MFDWLCDQCDAHKVRTLLIMGDLTDAKDNHSGKLINRAVQAVLQVRACVDHVYVLKGNHDYLLEDSPTFGFLSAFDGVHFISKPTDATSPDDTEPACYLLPHARTPASAWAGLDLSHYQLVFMHQTVTGAVASNGQRMEGDAMPDLSAAGKVWSGDIHVPQRIGPVEYVGSPYHVHFGDSFKARAVLLRSHGPHAATDLHFPSPRRVMLTVGSLAELRKADVDHGDHVKLRLALPPSEHHTWAALREQALEVLARAGVICHGVQLISTGKRLRLRSSSHANTTTPAEMVASFVEAEDWGAEALDVGLGLL